MNCMKCGRELRNEQVFCARCQTEMTRYPVKPNTVVQLPTRTAAPPVKKQPRKPERKSERKPEEIIRHLQRRIHWLGLFLVVVLLLLAVTVNILLHSLNQRDTDQEIGKNYTTQQA